jgi:hypothetical protein
VNSTKHWKCCYTRARKTSRGGAPPCAEFLGPCKLVIGGVPGLCDRASSPCAGEPCVRTLPGQYDEKIQRRRAAAGAVKHQAWRQPGQVSAPLMRLMRADFDSCVSHPGTPPGGVAPPFFWAKMAPGPGPGPEPTAFRPGPRPSADPSGAAPLCPKTINRSSPALQGHFNFAGAR